MLDRSALQMKSLIINCFRDKIFLASDESKVP